VVLASGRPGPAAVHHLTTLKAMGIEPETEPLEAPVVVDALVGYGLDGPLRGRAADLASWSSGRAVISLDIPSGHGHPGAIAPTATVTLALPKEHIREVRPLYLADLGLPSALWMRMGIDADVVFADGPILEVV